MKAYVVTAGHYSDYRIVGVALDHDIAEAILKYKCRDYGRIEEYDICEDRALVTKTKDYVQVWRIIFKKDGTIDSVEADGYEPTRREPYIDEISCGEMDILVYDNDKERAIKTAIDYRSMYLAKQYGINIS